MFICKAGVTRDTRLQTGRHTLRSGGQIHGHPSTHSPDNSMGTLRSSPSRVRPGNGRAPRYSTHLDRSDATRSSNLVIGFRGRSHTIRSPSLTCFQDDVLAGVFCLVLSRQPYAGGLAHYGSTDMVDATQAARVRTSRRAPCSGGQLHRHPLAHPPAPQMSLLQRSHSPRAFPTGGIYKARRLQERLRRGIPDTPSTHAPRQSERIHKYLRLSSLKGTEGGSWR